MSKLSLDEEGDEVQDEECMALEGDLNGALELNAQLKMMLAQAEEAERLRAEQMRQQGGQMRSGMRAPGPASGARMRGEAPPVAGPRMIGHAKNGGWGGKTHTQGRSTEIDRDNQILVSKLTTIAVKPTLNTRTNQPFRQNPATSSVAINRRRQDDKIARENAALAKRLNSVKPTGPGSKKDTAKHAAKHQNIMRNLAGPPPVSQQYSMMMLPPAPSRSRQPSATAGRRTPTHAMSPNALLRLGGGGPPDFAF